METAKPKLLVLDGQGVVFEAPFKQFLRLFAGENGLDFSEVVFRWKNQIRQRAWCGAIDDEMIWNELAGKEVDVAKTMRALHSRYELGPAAGRLSVWSQKVPIWLLSNHRRAWLLPLLEDAGLEDAFERLLISDCTGLVKPESDAFLQLLSGDISPGEVLFVDDKRRNTEAAEKLGICTILATAGSPWVEEIEARLGA